MRGTDPLPDTGRKNKQEEKGEMGITTFAAIDVGSYNVCMDIYEMSPRIGIRQIDEIRQRLEIGRDTYGKGKIAFDTASQLCHILKDFSHIMEGTM